MNKEYEYNSKAMGSDLSIAIVCSSKELADRANASAQAEVNAYETRFSRFLPDSELSKINGQKIMVVSKVFLDVTKTAYNIFVDTKGIFNPLVQISRFGYNKSFQDMSDLDPLEDSEPYDIDFSAVVIDEQNSLITLQEGQKLDFGGFLKGYVAELVAKKIESLSPDIVGVIVNLGGDIHTRGLDAKGNKFIFGVYNPITKTDDVFLELKDQSLATSGTYKRFWNKSGKKTHHILDASGTKNPETDIVSASVISQNGGRADAFAKVFLTLGPEKARTLSKINGLGFVVIRGNGQTVKNI